MIKAFPKIFAIGTDYIKDIFNEAVEITEKIDGSQFTFGNINGEFFMRSKGAMLYEDNPQNMFLEGMDYVQSISHLVPNDFCFYCEYLRVPKHNTLTYERIPKNHLMLFGVCSTSQSFYRYEAIQEYAEMFDIEAVPLILRDKIDSSQDIFSLIERKSILGGINIEGIVVKNYERPFLLGGQPIPLMAGKYVSEQFKEKHKNWNKENTGPGKWQVFKDDYRTEARWAKAVQHLKEVDELENAPRDIGKLIKEIQRDIIEEEQDEIKNFLWREFGKDVLRTATRGFPEWYKEQLVKKSFNEVT